MVPLKQSEGDRGNIAEMAKNVVTLRLHGNASKKATMPMGGELGSLLLLMDKGKKQGKRSFLTPSETPIVLEGIDVEYTGVRNILTRMCED